MPGFDEVPDISGLMINERSVVCERREGRRRGAFHDALPQEQHLGA